MVPSYEKIEINDHFFSFFFTEYQRVRLIEVLQTKMLIAKFENCINRTVPELEILTILPDLTLNFGRQVRQARLPTITAVALRPSC